MRRQTLAPLALSAILAGLSTCPVLAGPAEKLPADVMFVIDLDVAGIVKSDVYKKHSEKLLAQMPAKDDPDYLKFKQVTGFNPETDLQSVVLGLAGDVFGGKPTVYAIATGTFDQAKFDDYAKGNEKMTVGTQGAVTMYTLEPKEGEGAPPVFALLDKNTMLLTEAPSFPGLLGAANGSGASLKTHPKLGALISKAGTGQIRIAIVLPDQAKEQLRAQPQMAPLANVQAVDMSLALGTGADLTLEATADTPENGKAVYDTMNGLIALGKMSSGQNPDLTKLLDALKLEQAGANNKLTFSVSADDLDKLIATMQAQAGASEAPPSGQDQDETKQTEPEASATPQN